MAVNIRKQLSGHLTKCTKSAKGETKFSKGVKSTNLVKEKQKLKRTNKQTNKQELSKFKVCFC